MDIGLKSVEELLGMNFFIPNYQRGYRWTEQQVKDLLNDINEFAPNEKSKFYCLQPVVVKKKGSKWEVIDGQQRLTTIFLILKYLKKDNSFTLNYETRKDSANFLKEIEDKDDTSASINIDYYHILQAYKCIMDWFGQFHDNKETFKNKLLAKTKFIWYESDEEDPIKVFTRLNMWKIPLTNAELVKALFLNKKNFGKDTELQRLKQQEIAMQWDEIEYALWDNDMWFFFKSENRPTHIDVILDIVCDEDKGTKDGLGNDEYKTFRYFYNFYKLKGSDALLEKWKQIKEIFQTLKDWYDDIECYHYVSFLVENGVNVKDLLSKMKDKNVFIEHLKNAIKEKIKECKDLDKQYEIDGPNKTSCRPLLLLHNAQTVINQAKNIKEKYGNKSFTRFPFYIYKKENWDIEHIDSNTSNKLNDEKSQKEWLCNRYNAVDEDKQEKIMDFIKHDKGSFQELFENIEERPQENKLSDEEKNQIMNFVLLDANTNRGYKNAIFPAKRRIIIGKDKGKRIPQPTMKEDGKLDMEASDKGKSSFIPPCTKNVFVKYYSPVHTNPNYWTRDDALAYREDIRNTLNEFYKKEGKDNVQ